jgi:dihydropyrimidinase
MLDVLLRDGLVVTESGSTYGSVGIAAEEIVFIGSSKVAPAAKRVIDCEGRLIMPGLIDPHWHIGQAPGPPPPMERWHEEIGPESAAAAAGGITTIFAMYARQQPYLPVVTQLRSWAEEASCIDFGLHPIIQSDDQIAEIPALYAAGVRSYKFFFDAYKGWEGEQIALNPVTSGQLYRAMKIIAAKGDAVALVHAEDQDLIYELQEIQRASGRTDLAAWTASRPALAELTKSFDAIELAKDTGARLYIVHIGAEIVARAVQEARDEGYTNIFGETCPHYLTHTGDMEASIGCYGKVNNALKTEADRDALWRSMHLGGITNMGTDHVCWFKKDKEGKAGKHNNLWGSLPGIVGGTEHWLPVMLTYGVRTGRISLNDLVRLTSTANARTFGLYPKKGTIELGSDADVIVVDADASSVVDPATFYRSAAAQTWSLYEGERLYGRVEHSFVRGTPVVDGGEVMAITKGRFVGTPAR